MSDTHLIRSKYWFLLARNQLLERHPFSAGIVVSLLQDAAEIMCHAVAMKVGAQTKPHMSFPQYWEIVKNPASLPLRTEMGDLNTARVSYKHRGVLPDIAEAERFIMLTHQFLTETTRIFFDGVEFDLFSEADLIPNDKIRAFIKSAEQELNSGSLQLALERCFDAIEEINTILDNVVVVNDRRQFPPRPESREGAELLQWATRKMISHERALSLISIGVNPSEYWLVMTMLPQRNASGTKYFHVHPMTNPQPNRENVAEIIRIVIRTALKLHFASDSLSRIAAPFMTKPQNQRE